MKIHLIRKETIENFILQNSQGKSSFIEWLAKIRYADWKEPLDMRYTFPGADFLGNGSNRVIFDIAGNRYRMICKYAFGDNEVHLFICWIGTHAEYDKLCNNNKQFTVNFY